MNKKQKSITFYSLIIILIVIVAVFAFSGDNSSDEEVIKIGAVYPLTGFLSIYGDTERTATEFAVNEINGQGGINNKKLEVIYEDGKCSGSDALSAAKKLLDTDNVKIILGGSCSSETLSIAPYAKEENAIMFTSIASSPDISNYGSIFRNTIITSREGELLAEIVREKGYEKVAIITENNDFPISIKEGFTNHIGEDKIVYDELYGYGEQDFRAYLTKIKSKSPDAIIILPLGGNTGGELAKQIDNFNLDSDVYGAEVPGTNDFLEIAGDSANGVIYTDVPSLEKSQKLQEILEYFEEKGVTPIGNYFVAARYDSIQILKEALEECGENNSCIESYIKSNEFEGLIGKQTYNNKGDVQGINISLKKIVNQKPVLI